MRNSHASPVIMTLWLWRDKAMGWHDSEHRFSSAVTILIVALHAFAGPCVGAEVEHVRLSAYIEKLAKMKQCWQRAAELIHQQNLAGERDREAVLACLVEAPVAGLHIRWRNRHDEVVPWMAKRAAGGYCRLSGGLPAANWYVKAEAAALAVEAFAQAQERGLEFDDASILNWCQALTDLGECSKAELLREWAAIPKKRRENDVPGRLATLHKLALAPPPAPSMHLLRKYCLGRDSRRPRRVSPILAVWQMAVGAEQFYDRAKLLFDLFENARDDTGRKLTLEWIVGHPDEQFDDKARFLFSLIENPRVDIDREETLEWIATHPKVSAYYAAKAKLKLADLVRLREGFHQSD